MKTPLSLKSVEQIFARLLVTYGQPFLSQYDSVENIAIVHQDWANRLGVFVVETTCEDGKVMRTAPAIHYALANLKDGRPPNVLDFIGWCKAYHAPQAPALAPPPPREVPPEFVQKIAEISQPLDDDRPEAVRVASRYVASRSGKKITPREQENVEHFRTVLEDWARELERREHVKRQLEEQARAITE